MSKCHVSFSASRVIYISPLLTKHVLLYAIGLFNKNMYAIITQHVQSLPLLDMYNVAAQTCVN